MQPENLQSHFHLSGSPKPENKPMNQIQDYLQTQALKLNSDEIAIARAATQTVIAHAQAHIDNELLHHDKLPEKWSQNLSALKPLFIALDATYSRHPVQSVAIYALLPDAHDTEQNELVRLAQLGQPLENALPIDENMAWQFLAVRTAHSGWANTADDIAHWLATEELKGEHNRRATSQASLPICGEDGVIYGVLHLEHSAPLPENTLAAYLGLALGILPTLRQLCPHETTAESFQAA